MNKAKILVSMLLAFALIPIMGLSASAQGGTWVSGIQIQNQSTSDAANITVTFYNPDGTTAHSFNDTISAGASKTYYLPSSSYTSGLADGFIGSAVVSSDQPVAAIVNTQVPTTGTGTTSNPNRVGASIGELNPAGTMYGTQVMTGYYGWESYVAVQNTSESSTTVTAYYYDPNGNEVTAARETQVLNGHGSHVFRQSDNANLPDGVYSVKVDGGGADIAMVVNFYNVSTDYTTAQFQSYNGVSSGAEKLYIPRLVKDYYNYQGGFKVQNVGSVDTTVTVTYYFGGTTCSQTSPTLSNGQSWGPYMGAESQLPSCMAGVSGSGSAIVVANTPGASIIATVNEDNRVNPAGYGITYNAFPEGSGTHTVLFPQVTSKYYGYSGGWQVQNVDTGTATCTASYSASGNVSAFTTSSFTIPEGGSYSIFAPNHTGAHTSVPNEDNYNGAVTVNCDKNIVGIANMSHRSDVDPRYGVNYGDSYSTYNGINK